MEAPKTHLDTVDSGTATVSTPAQAGQISRLMSALTLSVAVAAGSVGCKTNPFDNIKAEDNSKETKTAAPTRNDKALSAQKTACDEVVKKIADSTNDKPFTFMIDGEGETHISAMCANDGEGQSILKDVKCEEYKKEKDGTSCDMVDGNQLWTVKFAGDKYKVAQKEAQASGKSLKEVTNLDQYCVDSTCKEASDNIRFVVADKLEEKAKPTYTPGPQPKQETAKQNPNLDRRVENLEATVARHDQEIKKTNERVDALDGMWKDAPSRTESDADDERRLHGQK